MMKLYQIIRHVFIVGLLLTSLEAWAQKVTVSGKVTSSDDGTSLPGVSILEKGTTNGTVTDADGNYSISAANDAVLVYSFVGYTTQEVTIGGQTTINITLDSDVTALSEVVVIGYGQQEKKDLTGTITNVTAKDFNRGVLTSPQDMLVGKVAGVSVNTNSGAPGSGATIRIRGGSSLNATNDPLIVIDGFPVDNGKAIGGSANVLASINPNDIESFTVLRDASATAIYGSRASNGVIIITTKKGKEGKPQISYTGNLSVSTPAKYFDVMSADEYRDFVNALVEEGNVSGLNDAALSRLGTANTDWQKEIYRDAISHDHNISVSGTTNNLPYRISYGYTDQQGILKTTYSKRNSLNVNLTPSFLDDHLKVTVSAKLSNTKNNFGNTGAVGAAVGFDPTQPVRNGNSRYGGYFAWTADYNDPESNPIDLAPSNPVALLNLTDNTSTVNRIIGNIQLDYRFHFLPDLRVNVNAGLDYTDSKGKNNTAVEAPWATDPGEGQLINYTGKEKSKLFDIYLNYTRSFGKHKVDLTAGHSYQSFIKGEGTNFSRNVAGTKFYDYQMGEDENGDPIQEPRDYIVQPNYLLSFFGRAFYSYNSKYLLTLTMRSDGSSRFSEDNRWGMFPSAALAWNIKEESFLSNVEPVSSMKFRVSYGVTGQQLISDNAYPYLPTYVESTNTAYYQFGNEFVSTFRPSPYDGNIKWEETSTVNVGLDFGIISDRFTASIDYYKRKTEDLLVFIPVAAGSTFSNYLMTNVGDLENTGIELTLNAKIIQKNDLSWNVGANFAHNANEIISLRKTADPNYPGEAVGGISGGVGNTIQIHTVGHPANSFYTFQQVYDASGMPIEGLYVDRTGQGGSVTSNLKNKYHNNSPNAKFLMGINTSVTYKNFDLYMSGRLSMRNYVYNNRAAAATLNSVYNSSGIFSNMTKYIYETGFMNPQYWSDIYVEDASFFKMDNISVGYRMDRFITDKLKARFGFTVQNAFVITDYSGIDPEVNDGFNPGVDNNIYPRPRNFVFSINLTY